MFCINFRLFCARARWGFFILTRLKQMVLWEACMILSLDVCHGAPHSQTLSATCIVIVNDGPSVHRRYFVSVFIISSRLGDTAGYLLIPFSFFPSIYSHSFRSSQCIIPNKLHSVKSTLFSNMIIFINSRMYRYIDLGEFYVSVFNYKCACWDDIADTYED